MDVRDRFAPDHRRGGRAVQLHVQRYTLLFARFTRDRRRVIEPCNTDNNDYSRYNKNTIIISRHSFALVIRHCGIFVVMLYSTRRRTALRLVVYLLTAMDEAIRKTNQIYTHTYIYIYFIKFMYHFHFFLPNNDDALFPPVINCLHVWIV